jgi:hypothetical protein
MDFMPQILSYRDGNKTAPISSRPVPLASASGNEIFRSQAMVHPARRRMRRYCYSHARQTALTRIKCPAGPKETHNLGERSISLDSTLAPV